MIRNIPNVTIGLVAVSRDCFPVSLSRTRRAAVAAACTERGLPVTEIDTVIENENHIAPVLNELEAGNINALIVYLGNFGPEGPLSILAQEFNGPVMFVAAAEETGDNLVDGRGDAYCGMLNASYNAGLRGLDVHIPEYPVGTAAEAADMIAEFVPVARIITGVRNLKIFSFGPRPQDFLACNAPIKALYDLGVEVMENSELDLYDIYKSAEGNARIPEIAADMAKELGHGNTYPDLLNKLAQYECALEDFAAANGGVSAHHVFANKCWPSFEKYFGFVPCYVNSRFATRGIPISCEVDIYGALSEYMATCATMRPATLLDINNSVPRDMYDASGGIVKDYAPQDLFMGFHCGNTPVSCMNGCAIKHQLIMHRLMEPDRDPDITRGTLEGTVKPGDVTLFRLQSTADTRLRSYVAQGEVLDMDPRSFGAIGVFAVPQMGRFYRHVLIEKKYPHHAAVAFGHAGKALYAALKVLGIDDVDFNRPAGMRYSGENPF